MFAEAGLPLVLSALFEMNPLLVTLMTDAAVAHEMTAVDDVRLALDSQREVTQTEQHVHSFLEVMPFMDCAAHGLAARALDEEVAISSTENSIASPGSRVDWDGGPFRRRGSLCRRASPLLAEASDIEP